MTKVLVVATSRKSTGGITSVLKIYEQSPMWKSFRCKWVGTHRDGNTLQKLLYLLNAMVQYILLLPFYKIVHIHFSISSSAKRKYIFFRLAKVYGKKTVIHLHCGSQIDDIWNDTYQTMFEQCDYGIVLTESLKTKVETHIGKSDRLKVVYNPCPILTRPTVYEKQNHILFSGHLIPDKGYQDLIKAFANVAKKHPDWKVVFAGNREVDQARALAERLGISKQVVLLGWVGGEEKHKAYSEAKVLCLPSYAEGFPMSVLDAWAYGIPVVTTPVGGIPDVAVDGENMLLFNPGDIDRLAIQIDKVMSDENLRNQLAEESSKLAAGAFNVKTITEQVGTLYNSL